MNTNTDQKQVALPVAVSVLLGGHYQAPRTWAERAYPKFVYEELLCYHHHCLYPDHLRRHPQTKSAGAEYQSPPHRPNGLHECWDSWGAD